MLNKYYGIVHERITGTKHRIHGRHIWHLYGFKGEEISQTRMGKGGIKKKIKRRNKSMAFGREK